MIPDTVVQYLHKRAVRPQAVSAAAQTTSILHGRDAIDPVNLILKGWQNMDIWFIYRVKVKVAQSCPALCDPMDYTILYFLGL